MSRIHKINQQSAFALVCEPHVTAVWKAVQVMTKGKDWIFIDDIAAFLQARQKEYSEKRHPENQAYLKPLDLGDMTGWDPPSIVHALSTAYKRGVLELHTTGNGHYFKSVPITKQYPWQVPDEKCPAREEWNTLYNSLEGV